jgi:hypothetical protein
VLFEKAGKSIVYVRQGRGFTPQPVTVKRLTDTRVVLEGLAPDAEVALADPDASRGATAKATSPSMPGGA